MTTMLRDGKEFFMLSDIVGPRWEGDTDRVVYCTGSWCLFHVNGQRVSRRVHTHNGYLDYVRMYGKRYFIDDKCKIA